MLGSFVRRTRASLERCPDTNRTHTSHHRQLPSYARLGRARTPVPPLARNKKPAGPGQPYGPRNGDGAPVSPECLLGYGSVPARKIVPSLTLETPGRTRNTTSRSLLSRDSSFPKYVGF